MAVILLALLVILILFGLGFALHVLWWIAIIALALWLLGFLLRAGSRPANTQCRGLTFYSAPTLRVTVQHGSQLDHDSY
jgi:hypothetical protein